MAEPPEKLVCEHCGSDNILADAYASWNVEKQEWELSTTFDAKYCQEETCDYQKNGYDQKGKWVPISEPKKERNFCSICGEPQFDSPSGFTCRNGHGGAASKGE